MEKVSVIIPCYGDMGTIDSCVNSVLQYSGNAEIILIDNSGSIGIVPQSLKLITPSHNIGFTRAINAGIALATSEYLVFLNCDTEVESHWLERMQKSFTSRTAAVGPLTDNPRQPQGRYERADETIQVFPEVSKHGWGWTLPISFFCVMVSRAAINDIGYLDDNFSPGYGEDDDWLYRAHLKNWQIRINKSVVIHHQAHATWDMELRSRCQSKAVKYLIAKHNSA